MDLDTPAHLDALLREPLDLQAPRARPRTVALQLLDQLGFVAYVEAGQLSDATLSLVFAMAEPLTDALDQGTVSVRARARRIADGATGAEGRGGRLDRALAPAALRDLGYRHLPVQAATVDTTIDTMWGMYLDEMTPRVTRMLRRWERRGHLVDAG